ncbi:hypothetical protein ACU18_13995 [Arthrobacter sp. ZBG10]|nr:hypothetical protein ACU18_13995 [Arthrobacter sp. ZBG10]
MDSTAWGLLSKAHTDLHTSVSPAYDEVLHEVSERIRFSGDIGKVDIGALLFWKRLRADTRWVRDLMVIDDSEVRSITAAAVTAVNDTSLELQDAATQGRAALSPLPGFVSGDALASALLTAAAPERMAVYDRRAQAGLTKLGVFLSAKRGRYGRYMEIVQNLAATAHYHGKSWTARDVDLALFWLGGQA